MSLYRRGRLISSEVAQGIDRPSDVSFPCSIEKLPDLWGLIFESSESGEETNPETGEDLPDQGATRLDFASNSRGERTDNDHDRKGDSDGTDTRRHGGDDDGRERCE